MAFASDNGNGMVMPVSPMYGGYGGGFGGFGGDWSAFIILFLIASMWGMGGMGGFGFGGFGGGLGIDFPWLLNGQNGINANTNAGFNQVATTSLLGDIQTSINTGFANAEVANCNRAMDAMQTAYNNQIASMNQSFANAQALDTRLDTIASNQQKCCCDAQLQAVETRNTIISDGATTRAAGTANTQAILDKLCQLELDGVKAQVEAKNDRIAELQSQLNMANLAASQASQTAQLEANNTAQTAQLIQRIAPYPTPSFIVGNPYGYNYNYGYGNCGCGN